jgi:hypothetical protein
MPTISPISAHLQINHYNAANNVNVRPSGTSVAGDHKWVMERIAAAPAGVESQLTIMTMMALEQAEDD